MAISPMIDVPCYLCRSHSRSVLLTQKGIDDYLNLVDESYHAIERNWFVCNDCGFVYRSPVLSNDDCKSLYKKYEKDALKNINPNDFFDKIIRLPNEESENYQKLQWLLEVLSSVYGEEFSKKDFSFLDVGCGSGLLMFSLKKECRNSSGFGVELNPEYAALASARSGGAVKQGLYRSGLFDRDFSLVILTKVLEHVPDPLVLISEMALDLKPGGCLFIEVPDVIDFKNLEADDPRFFIPHIYFFSAATIGELARRAGLRVLESRTIVTHRGRSYLQVVLVKADACDDVVEPPYDDPKSLLALVKRDD